MRKVAGLLCSQSGESDLLLCQSDLLHPPKGHASSLTRAYVFDQKQNPCLARVSHLRSVDATAGPHVHERWRQSEQTGENIGKEMTEKKGLLIQLSVGGRIKSSLLNLWLGLCQSCLLFSFIISLQPVNLSHGTQRAASPWASERAD